MKITLVPFAGLGNRLNAISSAIALRSAIDCDVTVYWESNADCQCQFTDLFLPISDIPVLPLDKFYLIRRGKRFLCLPMLLRRFIFDGCFKARKVWNSDFLLQPACSYQNVYVDANKRFCPLEETHMLSRFYRPTMELEERIEMVTALFHSYTVGVHIRRTDHKVVIAANPLDGFIKMMKKQMELHPACLFYIASDDETVKEQMRKLFPGRIITQPNVILSRNSVKGMKDAVVDLYTLARTNLIIGSRGSTYSDLASHLYDTPIEFINR